MAEREAALRGRRGASCASSRKRTVVLVPRRVEDGVPLRRRVEVRATHLNGLALGALLLVGVHDEGKEPRVAILLLGLLLVLLDRARVHLVGLVEDLPAEGRLARVDVANEDEVQVLRAAARRRRGGGAVSRQGDGG